MHKSETKHWHEWIHWHQECKFSLGVIVWLKKLSINLLYLPINLTLLLGQVGEQKLLTVFHWHWSGASPRDIGSTLALQICWSQVKLWSRGWEMLKLPPFWRGICYLCFLKVAEKIIKLTIFLVFMSLKVSKTEKSIPHRPLMTDALAHFFSTCSVNRVHL